MKVKTERHTTMVIVTHDIHGARTIGDKFAVLDAGRLLAYGTLEELKGRQDSRLQQYISERWSDDESQSASGNFHHGCCCDDLLCIKMILLRQNPQPSLGSALAED
jgi:ABC-type methionine transport system ATPase subunit